MSISIEERKAANKKQQDKNFVYMCRAAGFGTVGGIILICSIAGALAYNFLF